ncbi:MAG: YeiH family protein [Clostridiales bacterium]|nr:YeiH family protein [Clostridiales bacterium]
MKFIKTNIIGVVLCLIIAATAKLLEHLLPFGSIVGTPVFAIIIGLLLAYVNFSPDFKPGINFTSKKVLQYSIILLGFSMNLFNVIKVGGQSLAIIASTITVALVTAYVLGYKILKIPTNQAVLVGVGSSICGGSAIAATAPVIKAEDEDVASAISTIFLFNVIAAVIFPTLGNIIGMTDTGFGMWAGTAVNDTSSVVASATTWCSMPGHDPKLALDLATIVKLTRTLAIIPITFVLALYKTKTDKSSDVQFSLKNALPSFIIFFIVASIVNTVTNSVLAGNESALSAASSLFSFLSSAGKFMIAMAMAAIGLNTNLVSLVKNGKKPIFLGLVIWVLIAIVSLIVQKATGIW